MSNQNPTPLLEALSRVPAGIVRTSSKSNLFLAYSRKNFRRLVCEGVTRYRLCTLLEVDRSVAWFNEAPPSIDVPFEAGRAAPLKPLIASRGSSSDWTLHLLDYTADRTEPLLRSLEAWADHQQVTLKFWTSAYLGQQLTYIENLRMLLRYVAIPGRALPRGIQRDIEESVSRHGRRTTLQLICEHEGEDPELVKQALANALLDGRLFASLKTHAFTLQTAVSCSE